jgi:hypothetical protein
MGKYSLIVVSGFIVTFGVILSNLSRGSERYYNNLVDYRDRAVAELAARTMANLSLRRLSDSTSWRGGYSHVVTGGGEGFATVVDSTTDATVGWGRVRVTAWGTSGDLSDTAVVVAALPLAGVPPGVHGAITANSTVTTLGNIQIDGRDHDINGNLIANQGTKGVSTTQTYSQGGSSDTGGTSSGGTDYAPSNPANASVVEQNATYSFPSTPDAVFGYPEGTLKARALSGANGGQYVTNPASLTFPLSGVTYVELASGATWVSINFGASTGVLVVHNSSTNAVIKNLNTGTFKGLIIADDIDKIHTTVIGGVISLTTSPSGNCIGNGSGSVLYSSAALQQASSAASGGGAGSGKMTVVSWW